MVPVRCHYITRQQREKQRNGWGQERRKVEGEIKCVRETERERRWEEDVEEKWRWQDKVQSFLGKDKHWSMTQDKVSLMCQELNWWD